MPVINPKAVTRSPECNNKLYIKTHFGQELPHALGACYDPCVNCNSSHWKQERSVCDSKRIRAQYSACCQMGASIIPTDYDVDFPEELKSLMLGTDAESIHFRSNIRSFNNALSFTSLGAQVDRTTQGPMGVFSFRVHGPLYHNMRSVLPVSRESAGFAQIYVVGGGDDEEVELRIKKSGAKLNSDVMRKLQRLISAVNPFARFYRQVETTIAVHPAAKLVFRNIDHATFNPKTYNKPTVKEVAMVIHNAQDNKIEPRDVILHHKSGQIERTTDENSCYLPLRYPILFPRGQGGWVHSTPSSRPQRKTDITQVEWYASMLFAKQDRFNHLYCAGALFQELVVDLYICVERARLDYLRRNQIKLKAALYQGVVEAIRGDTDISGNKVILPATFVGSPRYMIQMYQDSTAIVAQYGKPSLFVNATANPQWPEIQACLRAGQRATDRPDVVTRVFNLKMKSTIHDLTKCHRLGRVSAYVYAVEFQKRGLPHVHIMLMLQRGDVPKTREAIDALVSAEIPDPDREPDLYALVSKQMVHGPCSAAKGCSVNGICSKGFPKAFQSETIVGEDSYPLYQRRADDRTIAEAGLTFSNQHIVPFKKYLLLRYNCHINVEIPYGIHATKYLFKYICKGVDRPALQLKQGDETLKFVHGRYVGPCEAVHRLLQFPICDRYPAVTRLALHLPGQQKVYYRNAQGARVQVEAGTTGTTTLTKLFELNQLNGVGYGKAARELLYHEVPTHFYWKTKEWLPRERPSDTIGRLFFVSPSQGERYYLRILLQNVKGPTGFDHLKRWNGIDYLTFREAAEARGLLMSDNHYEMCLGSLVCIV